MVKLRGRCVSTRCTPPAPAVAFSAMPAAAVVPLTWERPHWKPSGVPHASTPVHRHLQIRGSHSRLTAGSCSRYFICQ